VNAQTRKKLSLGQAPTLIAHAQNIQSTLGMSSDGGGDDE
jgi:hypothetical protein